MRGYVGYGTDGEFRLKLQYVNPEKTVMDCVMLSSLK